MKPLLVHIRQAMGIPENPPTPPVQVRLGTTVTEVVPPKGKIRGFFLRMADVSGNFFGGERLKFDEKFILD